MPVPGVDFGVRSGVWRWCGRKRAMGCVRAGDVASGAGGCGDEEGLRVIEYIVVVSFAAEVVAWLGRAVAVVVARVGGACGAVVALR